jgi:shikimate kinase
MKVFLAGVGCVGKTSIGACLAQRLGCRFYDLDTEIEEHFGRPIERLRAEVLTPYSFRKQFASVVLKRLVEAGPADMVLATMPSGLMDCMWAVLKKVDRVVVVLRDSAENILSRITFYNADSRPITKVLTEEQRSHYLREIRADTAYFGRTFHRADLTVDINGLDVEASVGRIDDMLRKWRAESGRRSR